MKKNTKQKRGEIIYGVHPLIELLKAGKRSIYTIYTTKPEPKAWRYIKPLLPKKPIQIQYVSRESLRKIAGTTDHQGFAALVQTFVFKKQLFSPKQHPFLVLLDSIQDVGNVGAIIRSAYCANCDGVVICQKAGAPLTAAAIKSSAGLAEHIPVYQAPSVQHAAKELKNAGYNLYLATLDGKDARSVEYKSPLCLVIGNEAKGISSSIMNLGEHITLAQRKSDISYNASVAAGILLFTVSSSLHKL